MTARLLPPLLLLLALPGAALAQQQLDTLVTLRDGTRLAAYVWTADGPVTPRPTLLRRTPYGRALDVETQRNVTGLGYNLVSVDVRGRGESEGAFLPFLDDALDGYDTIEWVAAQPWSNGRVGTFGGSAEGIVQLMAAGEAPPHLSCAMVTVATGDVHEAFYLGGAWRTDLGTNWLVGLQEPEALATLRAHEAKDALWERGVLDQAEQARVDVPILHVGGAFDIFSLGTPGTFAGLAARAASRADQFLVFGPWTHGGLSVTTQGELTLPRDGVYLGQFDDLLYFFEWCLKDASRPSWAPVRYYQLRVGDDGRNATGTWRTSETWPPAAQAATLFAHDDGRLDRRAPTGEGVPTALTSDPNAPVPSVGGGNLSTAAGPFDQSAIDARPDVWFAQTATVGEVVAIAGDAVARVYAASDGTDVDVVVRLSQVTPSGRVVLLADGIRRGRFVGGRDQARALVPGEVVAFDVALGGVAFDVPPGHALRVSLSATSSPRFEPNPGSIAPIATATPTATRLHLHRSAAHPTSITLPVVSGRLPGAEPEPPPGDAGVSGPDAASEADGGSTASIDAAVSGADAAVAAVDAGVATDADDDEGCGCRSSGAGGSGAGLVSVLALAAALLRRRL